MISWKGRRLAPVAAVCLALLASSCGSAQSPTDQRGVSQAPSPYGGVVSSETIGSAVTVDIDAESPFTVTLPGVATVEGAAGSVRGSGSIRLQALRGDASRDADFRLAGTGIDVDINGATLLRDVTVTFTGVTFPSDNPEIAYGVVHRRDDGQTDLRAARRIGSDKLAFSTRDFSANFPISIDLGAWLRGTLDGLGDVVAGRTNPDPCAGNPPSWATLSSSTTMVHECAIANKDGKGTPRAEAQFKTNRRHWTYAYVPPGAAYVWVKDQPEWLRTTFAWLGGERRENYVLLAPKDGLITVGYYQPAAKNTTVEFSFGSDGLTGLLSLTEAILGKLDVGGRSLPATAALLVAKCKEDVPGLLGSWQDKYFEYLKCISQQVLEQLNDPGKAFAAAMSLYGDAGYAQEASDGVARAKRGLQILGWVLKAAAVVKILRDEVNRIVDGVVALLAPSSKTVTFLLDAPLPPQKPEQQPVQPKPQPVPEAPGQNPAPAPQVPGPVDPGPTPAPEPAPEPAPQNPAFTGGYAIADSFLGGTWPRTDPNDGTWYSRSNRPANAASYWWANGLGVGFSCAARSAAYSVTFADGHKETWTTWLRSTDTWGGRVVGLWVPSAVADKVYADGIPPGMPTC